MGVFARVHSQVVFLDSFQVRCHYERYDANNQLSEIFSRARSQQADRPINSRISHRSLQGSLSYVLYFASHALLIWPTVFPAVPRPTDDGRR